eukprot:scaffold93390_cov57-Phaeocystis_antarctica.AAC.1
MRVSRSIFTRVVTERSLASQLPRRAVGRTNHIFAFLGLRNTHGTCLVVAMCSPLMPFAMSYAMRERVVSLAPPFGAKGICRP